MPLLVSSIPSNRKIDSRSRRLSPARAIRGSSCRKSRNQLPKLVFAVRRDLVARLVAAVKLAASVASQQGAACIICNRPIKASEQAPVPALLAQLPSHRVSCHRQATWRPEPSLSSIFPRSPPSPLLPVPRRSLLSLARGCCAPQFPSLLVQLRR